MSSPWSLAVNWIFAPRQTSILRCDKALWQPPIAPKRHQAITQTIILLRLVCTRSLKYQKTRDEA